MTEESYQQARKIMQRANYMRGMITTAKGNVAKWTKIEAAFREQLQESRADGAKKMLDVAMKKLKEARDKLTELKFPDSDIIIQIKRCAGCGVKISTDNQFCEKCLHGLDSLL